MKKVCVEIASSYFILKHGTSYALEVVAQRISKELPQYIEITCANTTEWALNSFIEILKLADASKSCKLLYVNVYQIHPMIYLRWPKFRNIKTLCFGPRTLDVLPYNFERTSVTTAHFSDYGLARDHLTMVRWIERGYWDEASHCKVTGSPYYTRLDARQRRREIAYEMRSNQLHLDAWNEIFPPLFLLLKKRVGPDIARLITREYLCPWNIRIKIAKTSVAAKRRVKQHARMLGHRAELRRLEAQETDLKRQRDELDAKVGATKKRKKEIIELLK